VHLTQPSSLEKSDGINSTSVCICVDFKQTIHARPTWTGTHSLSWGRLVLCRAVGSFLAVGRLIDESGDAAEGREIEARSADNSARSAGKNFFRIHFQLSGWALVALSYFED